MTVGQFLTSDLLSGAFSPGKVINTGRRFREFMGDDFPSGKEQIDATDAALFLYTLAATETAGVSEVSNAYIRCISLCNNQKISIREAISALLENPAHIDKVIEINISIKTGSMVVYWGDGSTERFPDKNYFNHDHLMDLKQRLKKLDAATQQPLIEATKDQIEMVEDRIKSDIKSLRISDTKHTDLITVIKPKFLKDLSMALAG